MRILICGSRTWTDRAAIRSVIAELPEGSVVIHGAARGADSIAGEEAERRGLRVEAYPADWEKHGRAAGPIRNSQMLKEGRPDQVIAFAVDLESSVGTRDMVRKAKAAEVPVKVAGGRDA